MAKLTPNTQRPNFGDGWQFWIDVGGTFTDCLYQPPNGLLQKTKVLSAAIEKRTWSPSLRTANLNEFLDPGLSVDTDQFWVGYQLSWQDADGQCVLEGRVVDFRDGCIVFESLARDLEGLGRATNYELQSPEPAPVFAVRRVLRLPLTETLPPIAMYLGTTRGTNALLTRTGARTVLLTTQGFADLLSIGDQSRPNLFDLNIRIRPALAESVVEIDERLDAAGNVLVPLQIEKARLSLEAIRRSGIESLAICLLHSYRNPVHERALGQLAMEIGFPEVSLSSELCPLIKILPRAETTVLNAYLNPVIRVYADKIRACLSSESRLQFMTSNGSLVQRERFSGRDSVLSGPAGGVVGFARAAEQAGFARAIGFDMGGTSTDVARFDGRFEQDFESLKANVRIVVPMLSIETVAAGGGSICAFNGTRLTVGPESASSIPGPACYGRGGPLAVTDINVFLGRISEEHFPFALDRVAIERRLDAILQEIGLANGPKISRLELALGFLEIANHNMSLAIRTVSVSRGYDPTDYVLVAFGGAGPQHATQVADLLGIRQVLVHPNASVLSADGIRLADRKASSVKSVLRPLAEIAPQELEALFSELEQGATGELVSHSANRDDFELCWALDLRFVGTEPFLNIELDCRLADSATDIFRQKFLAEHKRQFGYVQNREIEVVAARVTATIAGVREICPTHSTEARDVVAEHFQECVSNGRWIKAARFDWQQLTAGDSLRGPALVADRLTTVVVDAGWSAELIDSKQLILRKDMGETAPTQGNRKKISTDVADPILLEIFNSSFSAIARQMGITLQRTSVSVNVKDRLDFSCALFNSQGELIVNAPHIPVHLGAMSETVQEIIRLNPSVKNGDVFVTNDPYAGGSHLPDVTVVSPVIVEDQVAFWVASRGHHAEIGGSTPGSMPPNATCLADEGVLIQNLKLIDQGQEHFDRLEHLLTSGPYPSRNVRDNLADVMAQVAANRAGATALLELVRQYSLPVVNAYMTFVLNAAEQQIRAALRLIADGEYSFSDSLDNGRRIKVVIDKRDDRIRIDFTGTDPSSRDNLNANRAICLAAIMYVLRCLLKTDLPLNQGIMRPVALTLPECLLNPRPGVDAQHSPAIVGGNVETSQRVVDVLLGALGLAAASQGTMNNWLMGDTSFGYYETIGGGSGATAEWPGADAVHTHMTNTRLTDPEVLEFRYPVRLIETAIAVGTGGIGKNVGGCGMRRTIEFLRPLTVSLLTSRRNSQPYGMAGGGPGCSGHNFYLPDGETKEQILPSRHQLDVQPGDRLTIITPGGGAWGEI